MENLDSKIWGILWKSKKIDLSNWFSLYVTYKWSSQCSQDFNIRHFLLEFYKTKGHIEEGGIHLYALQMLGAALSFCPKCRRCKLRKLKMKR